MGAISHEAAVRELIRRTIKPPVASVRRQCLGFTFIPAVRRWDGTTHDERTEPCRS